MAARGTDSKNLVFSKLQEVFPNAFMDGKVMRVPCQENGETVEIKVSLTAAKDVLGGEVSLAAVVPKVEKTQEKGNFNTMAININEPTQEELDKVSELLKMF